MIWGVNFNDIADIANDLVKTNRGWKWMCVNVVNAFKPSMLILRFSSFFVIISKDYVCVMFNKEWIWKNKINARKKKVIKNDILWKRHLYVLYVDMCMWGSRKYVHCMP